jgi:hypothetical protein
MGYCTVHGPPALTRFAGLEVGNDNVCVAAALLHEHRLAALFHVWGRGKGGVGWGGVGRRGVAWHGVVWVWVGWGGIALVWVDWGRCGASRGGWGGVDQHWSLNPPLR